MSFRQRLREANAAASAAWHKPRPQRRSEPEEVDDVDYDQFRPIVDQDGVVWRRTLNYVEPPPWRR